MRLTWPDHITMKTSIFICPTSRCSFPRVRMLHQTIVHCRRSHELRAFSCGVFQVSIRYRIRPGQFLGILSIPVHTSKFTGTSWTSRNCSSGYNNEAHNYNVQMQVRQLEQEADSFFQDQGNGYHDFLEKHIKLFENQREILGNGSNIRNMAARQAST